MKNKLPKSGPTIGEKRFWNGGQRVQRIRAGDRGMFISTWAQFAWVVWDGQANPVTELLCNLEEVAKFPCTHCGQDMGIDRPSGMCSGKCLRAAQGIAAIAAQRPE